MKKIVCLGALLAGLAAFAGSAEPDGTDFVVTADAGESFTNSTAIGNYARLVKRGVGEVVLTAATTAFTGEVVVEAGTLSITDPDKLRRIFEAFGYEPDSALVSHVNLGVLEEDCCRASFIRGAFLAGGAASRIPASAVIWSL